MYGDAQGYTMNYESFSISDFLADPFFRKWVLHNDPAAEAFWSDWMRLHPGKTEEVNEARALLYTLREKAGFPDDDEIERRVADTISRLDRHAPVEKPRINSMRTLYYSISAACAALLILVLGWAYVRDNGYNQAAFSSQAAEVSGLVRVRSDGKNNRELILGDGSKIVLAPNSELVYPQTFDTLFREVSLNGEAYFEIARDTRRPFRVVAPDLVTEVLGTSFTVRSFESSPEASVSVKTGKVSVVTSDKKDDRKEIISSQKIGMILSPNQEAIYHRQDAKLIKKLAPNPEVVVSIPRSNLIFDATPMVEVLKTISMQYGVHMVYNEDLLSNCLLTGDLTDNSLYEQLDFICRLANARYDIVEGQIIIHSSGCPETL